jgi:hypothetical protein
MADHQSEQEALAPRSPGSTDETAGQETPFIRAKMVNYKLVDLGRDLVREGFRERHQRLWARILYRMAQQVPFRARGRIRSPFRIMRGGERERHDLAFVGTRPSIYSNFGSRVEPPTLTAILPVYLPTESTVVVRWMWD